MKILLLSFLLLSPSFLVAQSLASLFDYKTVWRDQNNAQKKMQDFAKRPFLLSMVYTSCPHTCPMTITKIQQIKDLLEKNGHRDIGIVLASFDEVGDTPENLKAYVKKRKLDEKIWTFLSPVSQKEARELSVLLGISYKKLGEGDFSHSNVISLVNSDGKVVAKIDNLSADISVFRSALDKK